MAVLDSGGGEGGEGGGGTRGSAAAGGFSLSWGADSDVIRHEG